MERKKATGAHGWKRNGGQGRETEIKESLTGQDSSCHGQGEDA